MKTHDNHEAAEPTKAPTPLPAANPAAADMLQAFADSIASAIDRGSRATVAALAPKQTTLADVLSDPTNPANRMREKRLHDTGVVYKQNGFNLNHAFAQLSDPEMDLLIELADIFKHRSSNTRGANEARFVNGLVTVRLHSFSGQHILKIDHAGATPDQRIQLKTEVRNFTELLTRVVVEARAADAKGVSR